MLFTCTADLRNGLAVGRLGIVVRLSVVFEGSSPWGLQGCFLPTFCGSFEQTLEPGLRPCSENPVCLIRRCPFSLDFGFILSLRFSFFARLELIVDSSLCRRGSSGAGMQRVPSLRVPETICS